MAFMIALIIVLLWSVWRGWRTGLLHQLAGVLGIAFGVVAARLLYPGVSLWLEDTFPVLSHGFAHEYKLCMLSMALVFGVVYLSFSLLAGVLRSALSVLQVGALNSVAGAGFSFLKWVMVMSVAYNVLLAVSPTCALADFCDDGDGNVVELVMGAAPFVVGVAGPDRLLHERQLDEAKAISYNLLPARGVELYVTQNVC